MNKLVESKTVLLVRNAYLFDFGGAERFPINLATELEIHRYRPIIASRSKKLLSTARASHVKAVKAWWWNTQNWTGSRVVFFPVYVLWQIALLLWYLQLLLRLRPAVVHLQSRDDFIAGTWAARLLGKKVIWTDHADLKYIFANHRKWYKNPVGKLVYLASRSAGAIVLVSQDERRSIENDLGKKLGQEYKLVHNGVADVKPSPVQINSADITFCTTSRLVTAKGIGEIITAFAEVQKTIPKTQLLLVGAGPEEAKFKKMARGLKNIVFVGHSDNPMGYVAAADIFVHPSYHEAFSISLVEAAMLGKPIVACDVGGNPEIITNSKNGLLVPPQDAETLAKAMLKLAQDPKLRQEYGMAARRTYESGFDFAKIVQDKYIPLYES